MTPAPLKTPFSRQAAKASWTSVIAILVLGIFGQASGSMIFIDLLSLVFMCTGFSLGAISLLGIRKYGAKGILMPAMVGLILNGLLLFIFITNFLAAMAQAQQGAL